MFPNSDTAAIIDAFGVILNPKFAQEIAEAHLSPETHIKCSVLFASNEKQHSVFETLLFEEPQLPLPIKKVHHDDYVE